MRSNSSTSDNKVIAYSDDGTNESWTYEYELNGLGLVYGEGRFIIVDDGQVHIIGD